MWIYFLLKAVHILAAVLFLGTGLGSAFYKWRADRSDDLRVIVWAQRNIVLADWLFTVPAGLALPVTGLWLVYLYDLSLFTPWILVSICGYLVAGLTWLPAAWLQLRMQRLAETALEQGAELSPLFEHYRRIWLGLGVPSFLAALVTVWAMVAKHRFF